VGNDVATGSALEYLIGLILSVAAAGFATAIGLERERASYPTVLIVIASYYVLFAGMGVSSRALLVEIVVASGFLNTCCTRWPGFCLTYDVFLGV
jgi:hypothetical protein